VWIWPPGAELLISATLLAAIAVIRRVALAVRQGTTSMLYVMAAAAGIARLSAKEVIVVVRTGVFAAAHLISHVGGDKHCTVKRGGLWI